MANQHNVNRDISANVSPDGEKVTYTSQNSQVFEADDFISVYNDTITQLETQLNQLENSEQQIEELLEEKEEAMQIIHTLVESEPQNDAQLEPDSLTVDDLNAFMQLQQKQQQRNQKQQQIEQIRIQIDNMQGAAERLADDEELKEVPEKEE